MFRCSSNNYYVNGLCVLFNWVIKRTQEKLKIKIIDRTCFGVIFVMCTMTERSKSRAEKLWFELELWPTSRKHREIGSVRRGNNRRICIFFYKNSSFHLLCWCGRTKLFLNASVVCWYGFTLTVTGRLLRVGPGALKVLLTLILLKKINYATNAFIVSQSQFILGRISIIK